ncbi:MAG TPA: hypothetical protein VIB49_05110 [Thermoplasmata archaeon]|jgi:hypothetical protein
MAAPSEPAQLEVLFGRAFLLALERGELERAQVFARAFLARHVPASDVTAGLNAA